MCQAFYALVKHVSPKGGYFTPKGHYFAPQGHYFAHRCEKGPFFLFVNGAKTRVLHACVKKKTFSISFEVCDTVQQPQRIYSSIIFSNKYEKMKTDQIRKDLLSQTDMHASMQSLNCVFGSC